MAGGLLERDGELVAAEAGDGVLAAHAGREPPGHRGQQVVAGGVAERVVDVLKSSRSMNSRASGVPAWERRLERVPHPLPEQGPVGQAGEPVVEGPVPEGDPEAAVARHPLTSCPC